MPSGIYIRTQKNKEKQRLAVILHNSQRIYKRGFKLTEETKKRMSETHKRNGTGKWMKSRTAWNKGISFNAREKHWNWKGDVPRSANGRIVYPVSNKSDNNSGSRVKNGSRVRKTALELLERKRFRNQRYKAAKRNATGTHTFQEWLMVKEYYRNMCLCCKRQEPEVKLTEDHVIPLSMNGSDDIANIQPLCVICNTKKNKKYIDYRYWPDSNVKSTPMKGLVN